MKRNKEIQYLNLKEVNLQDYNNNNNNDYNSIEYNNDNDNNSDNNSPDILQRKNHYFSNNITTIQNLSSFNIQNKKQRTKSIVKQSNNQISLSSKNLIDSLQYLLLLPNNPKFEDLLKSLNVLQIQKICKLFDNCNTKILNKVGLCKFLLSQIQKFGSVRKLIQHLEQKYNIPNYFNQQDIIPSFQKENNTITTEPKVVFGKISSDHWISPTEELLTLLSNENQRISQIENDIFISTDVNWIEADLVVDDVDRNNRKDIISLLINSQNKSFNENQLYSDKLKRKFTSQVKVPKFKLNQQNSSQHMNNIIDYYNCNESVQFMLNSRKLDDLVMKDLSMISESSQITTSSTSPSLYSLPFKHYKGSDIIPSTFNNLQNDNTFKNTQDSGTQISEDEINQDYNLFDKLAIKRVCFESQTLGLVLSKRIRNNFEDAIIHNKLKNNMNNFVFSLLCIGDVLIAINDVNVERLTFLEKIELIKQKNRPIILDFMTGNQIK